MLGQMYKKLSDGITIVPDKRDNNNIYPAEWRSSG